MLFKLDTSIRPNEVYCITSYAPIILYISSYKAKNESDKLIKLPRMNYFLGFFDILEHLNIHGYF